MFSAAPFAARPAPSLSVAVACLSLVGCGNRGELYLPSEAELEVDGPAFERSSPGLEEGVEPTGRTLTPSDTVNGLTASGDEDDRETEREDGRGKGEEDEDGPARARDPVAGEAR